MLSIRASSCVFISGGRGRHFSHILTRLENGVLLLALLCLLLLLDLG